MMWTLTPRDSIMQEAEMIFKAISQADNLPMHNPPYV